MRNILLLLILAVVANIKVFAAGGTLYECNDTIVADTLLSAGSQSDVKSFFTARLDSLVAKFDTLAIDSTEAEEYTNPAFVRMFVRPTLYRSVLGEEFYKDIVFDGAAQGTRLGDDAERSRVIGGVLLNLYKNNPSRVWATEDELRKELGFIPEIEYRYRSTNFAHVFGGGYAVGYYAYLWAEVLDCDAFELFLEKGVFDSATAKAFKNLVEMGGSKDPMREYRKFRGADANPDALLRARGLK